MALINIQSREKPGPFSVFVLGFRPFFLAAGLFAMISIGLWMAIFGFALDLDLGGLPAAYWHAHEMLFGYAMAVIAGFLLTAVKNWTGVQTWQNRRLLLLLLLWSMARLFMLAGQDAFWLAALFDLSFNLLLVFAVLEPVVRVRQWTQIGILSKLLLLTISNLLFFIGAMGWYQPGFYLGIYIAFFLVIALILTMGRRVIPSFIENGVGYPVKLRNSRSLDLVSLFGFLVFAVNEVFVAHPAGALLAGLLFIVTSWRLYNWHTPGIWRAPLLWGLYCALLAIDVGFLLYALAPLVAALHESLALHSMAFGGIGLITLSMMSRVTLGHTGRDVRRPSGWIALAQGMILLGLLVRVGAPLLLIQYYALSIMLAQGLWIAGFGLFLLINAPYLLRPRIDGSAG